MWSVKAGRESALRQFKESSCSNTFCLLDGPTSTLPTTMQRLFAKFSRILKKKRYVIHLCEISVSNSITFARHKRKIVEVFFIVLTKYFFFMYRKCN